MHSVDVVIVGGGPAGAATALALVGHGLEVAVVERSCYDTVRIGETVGPWISKVSSSSWASGSAFLPTLHNPSHAVHAVWGSAAVSHQDFICHPYGVGGTSTDGASMACSRIVLKSEVSTCIEGRG